MTLSLNHILQCAKSGSNLKCSVPLRFIISEVQTVDDGSVGCLGGL